MVTVRHRQAVASMGPSAGEVAADVFTLLDENVHPADIVKRLKLLPEIVSALHLQWTQMRAGFVMTADDADELGVHCRARRATSAREALAQVNARVATLQRLNASPQCKFCGDRSACVCEPCVIQARGPLWTTAVRLEPSVTETDGARTELLRVRADVCWDETIGEGGGRVVTLRSDWYPREALGRSPIADFVEALEATAASTSGT